MEITEVKVFLVSEDKLKAFVSIVVDQCFMVNDIKVIQGRDGLFISMPSRKKKNGEFKDVAHPLNNETRRMIEDRILLEYGQTLGEQPVPPRGARSGASAELMDGTRGAAARVEPEPSPEPTLEEIQELHLNDSFWSLT